VSAPTTGAVGSRVGLRVVIWGLAYLVIGIATAALSRGPGPGQIRIMWRWIAWVASAIAFAAQIWYERIRAAVAPARAALRAALAVALGGLLLAVAATNHALRTGSARIVPQLIALVVWPVLLAIPAFLVAWAAAALLAGKKSG